MTKEKLQEILILHSAWLRNEANGVKANLSGTNLFGANLSGANLSEVNLSGACLSEANLSGANLSEANLSRADLFRANLFGACLSGANLSRANLSRANLFMAYLSGADLSGADLSWADLSKTIYKSKRRFEFSFNKHTALYFETDEILIGCHRKSIQYWINEYKDVGEKEGYTSEEIKEYGKFIRWCDRMYKKSNGGKK